MRRAASTSRTSGRYAVGPYGPIPDTDAYPDAPTDDQKKIKQHNRQVDRPRPFRDDRQNGMAPRPTSVRSQKRENPRSSAAVLAAADGELVVPGGVNTMRSDSHRWTGSA